MSGDRVLVTGGAGFIGSNLANGLAGDNEVVEMINDELGTNINPIPQDVYVAHTCADCSKLHRATGWEPQIELRDGIERVWGSYPEVIV